MDQQPSAAARSALEGLPQAQASLLAALEERFGSFSAPRFGLPDQLAGVLEGEELLLAERHGPTAADANARAALAAEGSLRAASWRAAQQAGRHAALPRAAFELQAAIEQADFDARGEQLAGMLAGWYPSLAESAELYRQECARCHGSSGGGDGPSAASLMPRPRNFQRALFKWTQLAPGIGARREDLEALLREGVVGSAMPAFERLSLAEREGLVDYVTWLALRGLTEGYLLTDWDPEEPLDEQLVEDSHALAWDKWAHAAQRWIAPPAVIPEPTSERVQRGRELFASEAGANCARCHGISGLGDGLAATQPDPQWVASKPGEQPRRIPLTDVWGAPILPRNLQLAPLRGGSSPLAIYRRIHSGINGTPMPGHASTTAADGTLLFGQEELWDLVFYVRALHFEGAGAGGTQ